MNRWFILVLPLALVSNQQVLARGFGRGGSCGPNGCGAEVIAQPVPCASAEGCGIPQPPPGPCGYSGCGLAHGIRHPGCDSEFIPPEPPCPVPVYKGLYKGTFPHDRVPFLWDYGYYGYYPAYYPNVSEYAVSTQRHNLASPNPADHHFHLPAGGSFAPVVVRHPTVTPPKEDPKKEDPKKEDPKKEDPKKEDLKGEGKKEEGKEEGL